MSTAASPVCWWLCAGTNLHGLHSCLSFVSWGESCSCSKRGYMYALSARQKKCDAVISRESVVRYSTQYFPKIIVETSWITLQAIPIMSICLVRCFRANSRHLAAIFCLIQALVAYSKGPCTWLCIPKL